MKKNNNIFVVQMLAACGASPRMIHEGDLPRSACGYFPGLAIWRDSISPNVTWQGPLGFSPRPLVDTLRFLEDSLREGVLRSPDGGWVEVDGQWRFVISLSLDDNQAGIHQVGAGMRLMVHHRTGDVFVYPVVLSGQVALEGDLCPHRYSFHLKSGSSRAKRLRDWSRVVLECKKYCAAVAEFVGTLDVEVDFEEYKYTVCECLGVTQDDFQDQFEDDARWNFSFEKEEMSWEQKLFVEAMQKRPQGRRQASVRTLLLHMQSPSGSIFTDQERKEMQSQAVSGVGLKARRLTCEAALRVALSRVLFTSIYQMESDDEE